MKGLIRKSFKWSYFHLVPYLFLVWLFFHGRNIMNPTMGVGDIAPLDTGKRIIQFLCQRAGFEIVNGYDFTLIIQFSDRRNNGGSTGSECFF